MSEIEVDLKYCPSCDDEYRADMTCCPVCEVDLITGAEKLGMYKSHEKELNSRSMELSADDELGVLRKGSVSEMKQMQGLLAERRIPSIISGDKSGCGKGCCGSEVYLQIRIADSQAALEVLAAEFHATTRLADHDLTNIDQVFDTGVRSATCPACGHTFKTNNEACPDCGLAFA
ncbi:MAG: hypothetical protein ABFS19_11990 [Thermodesulfobacteriota bacterium]